jgi:hypothetical protein
MEFPRDAIQLVRRYKGLSGQEQEDARADFPGILQILQDFPEVKRVLTDLEEQKGREDAEKAILGMSFEDLLGIKKWDQQAAFLSNARRSTKPEDQIFIGVLPEFIQKTDQERIQNLPEVFEEWQDKGFQESTKMDGSSMTVYFIPKDSP